MADELTSLDAVRMMVTDRAAGRSRTIVGITGPPGAGKTHFAGSLASVLSGSVIAMDGFHRSNAELIALGRHGRKGAPDTFDVPGFLHVLTSLRNTDAVVTAPSFDRRLDEPAPDTIVVAPDVAIVIVEGNYLLLDDPPWADVAPLLDLTLYLEVSAPVRRTRLLVRQARRFGDHEVARRWVDEVDDANARLVEATRRRAEHVVTLVGPRARPRTRWTLPQLKPRPMEQ